MNLEGLNAILTKEEVIATQTAEALLERPREVDDAYKAHVRTYVPLHAGRGEGRRPAVAQQLPQALPGLAFAGARARGIPEARQPPPLTCGGGREASGARGAEQ